MEELEIDWQELEEEQQKNDRAREMCKVNGRQLIVVPPSSSSFSSVHLKQDDFLMPSKEETMDPDMPPIEYASDSPSSEFSLSSFPSFSSPSYYFPSTPPSFPSSPSFKYSFSSSSSASSESFPTRSPSSPSNKPSILSPDSTSLPSLPSLSFIPSLSSPPSLSPPCPPAFKFFAYSSSYFFPCSSFLSSSSYIPSSEDQRMETFLSKYRVCIDCQNKATRALEERKHNLEQYLREKRNGKKKTKKQENEDNKEQELHCDEDLDDLEIQPSFRYELDYSRHLLLIEVNGIRYELPTSISFLSSSSTAFLSHFLKGFFQFMKCKKQCEHPLSFASYSPDRSIAMFPIPLSRFFPGFCQKDMEALFIHLAHQLMVFDPILSTRTRSLFKNLKEQEQEKEELFKTTGRIRKPAEEALEEQKATRQELYVATDEILENSHENKIKHTMKTSNEEMTLKKRKKRIATHLLPDGTKKRFFHTDEEHHDLWRYQFLSQTKKRKLIFDALKGPKKQENKEAETTEIKEKQTKEKEGKEKRVSFDVLINRLQRKHYDLFTKMYHHYRRRKKQLNSEELLELTWHYWTDHFLHELTTPSKLRRWNCHLRKRILKQKEKGKRKRYAQIQVNERDKVCQLLQLF